MYTKRDFGIELIDYINSQSRYDVKKTSDWAHEKYLEFSADLDKELYVSIMKIIAMQEGKEFQLSKAELITYAQQLRNN